jgi:enoyl-CoA hydratase/carnithine racemase
MMLTGDPVSADEALRLRLVQKVVPGAGHCMHLEACDVTNDLILEFIERKS